MPGLREQYMVEAFTVPTWPPGSPWEAYILALAIPLLLRLWLLRRPLIDLVEAYAPAGERKRHLNWVRKNLNRLPIEGFGGLLRQEVFAFVLPSLAALIARLWIGEIGWQTWDDVPELGMKALIIALLAWTIWDFSRVMRTRRSLKKLARLNLERLKRGIERAIKGHELLRGFEEFRMPRPWNRIIDVDHTVDGEEVIASQPNLISRLALGLLDKGADAIDMGLGVAKMPAVGIADAIEGRMQAVFDGHMRNTRDAMFRNVMFSITPLLVLKFLPDIIV